MSVGLECINSSTAGFGGQLPQRNQRLPFFTFLTFDSLIFSTRPTKVKLALFASSCSSCVFLVKKSTPGAPMSSPTLVQSLSLSQLSNSPRFPLSLSARKVIICTRRNARVNIAKKAFGFTNMLPRSPFCIQLAKLQSPCQWLCPGRKVLQRQSFPKAATA